ncbi:MAG: site-specific DNA-methyltransferase [Synergistaceae bacterium]|nr:site-specific DNA-methyltransferase [Synergistaceae bacterium]
MNNGEKTRVSRRPDGIEENKQSDLFNLEPKAEQTGPVKCLGMTFSNDEERRKHFLSILREKLKDPEFRKIEGFPIGLDEDILALSDPPYYTACPNPFIADFIKYYGKPYDPSKPYNREPFAADVSEGKNDPIYNAHSYHTKVPHKAIMRYILHYTEPGDIVFDSFCGTGMTGVAAQMCGNREVVMSLGYKVKLNGTILQKETDESGRDFWHPFSKLGVRRALLNDLSPLATFIASNYNTPVDMAEFKSEAKRILNEVQKELGWMYETVHTSNKAIGKINYVVWSDVLICSNCGEEVVYWDAAVDKDNAVVKEKFNCTNCFSEIKKRYAEKAYESYFDDSIAGVVRMVKQVPVLINYTVGKKRYEKKPDLFDTERIAKINKISIEYDFPTIQIKDGAKTREPLVFGATYTHLMYTRRNLSIIVAVLDRIERIENSRLKNYLKVWFTSSQTRLHKMNRYAAQHQRHVGPLANTLYISSTPAEISPFYFFDLKIKENTLTLGSDLSTIVQVGGASGVLVPENTLDYIFLDPPFGHNIMYSDLNIIWEAWLRVRTNSLPEAIENKHQGKGLDEYRSLMVSAFSNAYQALKPGRWLTVEFSNTKASVWNSIQSALTVVGFVVANVATLNKGRGGLHAIIGPTAVKQDLVISAYKPNEGFEERFHKEASTEVGVWDFVRTHLKYLPVVKRGTNANLIVVTERDPRILYDQMVAYYVRKGYPVLLNSTEFQAGLPQRFSYRDGMYFLPDQVAEYDKKKMAARGMEQIKLFISDESSAIAWLCQLLKDKPQSFQDIHPLFIKELGGWQKYEKPLELSELLEQNFIRYDGKDEVPTQIHSYLSTNFKDQRNLPKDDENLRAKGKDRWYVPDPNKAGDLEKMRDRLLLKEFEDYHTSSQKRLKVFRIEAVRAGFKKAWQERDYATIITVAHKIPEDVLQEDPKLLMWYDQALTRSGKE